MAGIIFKKVFEASQACKTLLILLSDATQLFCLNGQTPDESARVVSAATTRDTVNIVST